MSETYYCKDKTCKAYETTTCWKQLETDNQGNYRCDECDGIMKETTL